MSSMYDCFKEVRELGIDVPDWIDQSIAVETVAAILQGGCASGSYMPAVTYHDAAEIMSEFGDNVLDFLNYELGETPAPMQGESWSGLACFYLSCAVELWAENVRFEIEEMLEDKEEQP